MRRSVAMSPTVAQAQKTCLVRPWRRGQVLDEKTIRDGVPVGFARLEHGTRKTRLVGRVGEMPLARHRMRSAAGISTRPFPQWSRRGNCPSRTASPVGGQDFHCPSGCRLEPRVRPGPELPAVWRSPSCDRSRRQIGSAGRRHRCARRWRSAAEVERRSRYRSQLARGDEGGVDGGEVLRVKVELVPENVARTGQVEIRVVGQVDDGVLVRGRREVDA